MNQKVCGFESKFEKNISQNLSVILILLDIEVFFKTSIIVAV